MNRQNILEKVAFIQSAKTLSTLKGAAKTSKKLMPKLTLDKTPGRIRQTVTDSVFNARVPSTPRLKSVKTKSPVRLGVGQAPTLNSKAGKGLNIGGNHSKSYAKTTGSKLK